MKRQEGHQSVANNVRFLAYFLAFHDLIRREYPFLRFGNLLEGQIDSGIYDKDWANRIDQDEVPETELENDAQPQQQLAFK